MRPSEKPGPACRRTWATVHSSTVSVVSPRKSNFTRPIASTSSLSSWDTTFCDPSAAYSGQKSGSLPGAMSTPPGRAGGREQLAGLLFGLLALREARLHPARVLQRDQLAGLERDELRQLV